MTQQHVTIDVIAPPAPASAIELDGLENDPAFMDLLSKLYEADRAMEQWKTWRDDLRTKIAGMVAASNNGEYKGKTVQIGAGWKFVLTVTNGLNVRKSHERYKELPTRIAPDRLNQICYRENKQELKWRKDEIARVLTPDERAYFAEVLDTTPTLAFKFEQKTDDR